MENTDPLPSKPTPLGEFAERFLAWVDDSRLEEKTRKFYRNGWRLLNATPVAEIRVNQITNDFAEHLKFPGSATACRTTLPKYGASENGYGTFYVTPEKH